MTTRHDERNRMTKLQTVILAITCFVLAGIAYKFIPSAEIVAAGLGGIGMWLFGLAQRHPADKAKLAPSDDKLVPPAALLVLIVAGGTLFASPASAEGMVWKPAPDVQCSPVGTFTGYQFNLKTKDFQKGVALGGGYGCRYVGWVVPVGLNLVGGASVSENAPNAAQGSLILTLADNYGIGGGAQVFRDPVSRDYIVQGLLSFFVTASWAATVEQLREVKAKQAEACPAPRIQMNPNDF